MALLALAPACAVLATSPRDNAVTATLSGEFALQAGKLDASARWYLQAAQAAPGDTGLAERATRIALLAGNDAIAAQALDLWRQRAPGSLAMRAAGATLALHRHDARSAASGLESLLRGKDAVAMHQQRRAS